MVTKYMCILCGAMDNQRDAAGQGVDALHKAGCLATHLSKCQFASEIDARMVSNGLQKLFGLTHEQSSAQTGTVPDPIVGNGLPRKPMSEKDMRMMEMNDKAFAYNARMSALQIAFNMVAAQPGSSPADIVRYADTLYQFSVNNVVPAPSPTNGTVLAMVPGKLPSDPKY